MFRGKRSQLVDGVEGLALNARGAIERIEAHGAVDLCGNRLRAGVAICHGVAHAVSARIDQHEIDAPGVDADRCGNFARGGAFLEANQDVFPNHINIPAIMAATAHLGVIETVHLFEHDFSVFDMAKHVAPARRPNVNCQVITTLGH